MTNLLAMSTSDYNNTWHFLIQLVLLAATLLVAYTMRRKIPFIRKSLLPSAVVGGIVLLLLKLIPPVKNAIDEQTMEIISYHCLALGFISMALKDNGAKKKGSGMTIFKTGATVVNTYLVQAILGIAITSLFALFPLYKDKLFAGGGVLICFGFGQGPGQALNNGNILQNAHPYFEGASFGLAVATIGFLIACVFGVLHLNVIKRKGKIKVNSDIYVDETHHQAKDIIPVSESMDRFSLQLCLVLTSYGIAYLIMLGIEAIANTGVLGDFGHTVSELFYGFNFLLGTVAAILVKLFIKGMRKARAFNHTYTDNYLLSRLSGLMFDIMIIAATAAIDFDKLEGLWLPLIVGCGVCGIATFAYLRFMCKKLYRGYEEESFISLFGMLTGTASTGTILLREIDPEFKTPASYNLVMQQMPAVLFGFPIMLIVGYLKVGTKEALISMGILAVLFVLFNLFTNFDFKRKKFIPRGGFIDEPSYDQLEDRQPRKH